MDLTNSTLRRKSSPILSSISTRPVSSVLSSCIDYLSEIVTFLLFIDFINYFLYLKGSDGNVRIIGDKQLKNHQKEVSTIRPAGGSS
jgi:hypothetical protein